MFLLGQPAPRLVFGILGSFFSVFEIQSPGINDTETTGSRMKVAVVHDGMKNLYKKRYRVVRTTNQCFEPLPIPLVQLKACSVIDHKDTIYKPYPYWTAIAVPVCNATSTRHNIMNITHGSTVVLRSSTKSMTRNLSDMPSTALQALDVPIPRMVVSDVCRHDSLGAFEVASVKERAFLKTYRSYADVLERLGQTCENESGVSLRENICLTKYFLRLWIIDCISYFIDVGNIRARNFDLNSFTRRNDKSLGRKGKTNSNYCNSRKTAFAWILFQLFPFYASLWLLSTFITANKTFIRKAKG